MKPKPVQIPFTCFFTYKDKEEKHCRQAMVGKNRRSDEVLMDFHAYMQQENGPHDYVFQEMHRGNPDKKTGKGAGGIRYDQFRGVAVVSKSKPKLKWT